MLASWNFLRLTLVYSGMTDPALRVFGTLGIALLILASVAIFWLPFALAYGWLN